MRSWLFLILLITSSLGFAGQKLNSLYVTYDPDNPCNGMWIVWHSENEKEELIFKKEDVYSSITGHGIPFMASKLFIHRVKLEGLRPGSLYSFKIGKDEEEYLFKTMPNSLERPLKVVIGGDVYKYLHTYRQLSKEITFHDPDFVVIGGDIAYTKNNHTLFKGANWEVRRWETFFKEWFKTMRGKDGRLIPMLVAVGNHDIKEAEKDPFFSLFPQFKALQAHAVYDFGNYLSLFLLDTGHVNPVTGAQQEWLKESLALRNHQAAKIAVYHISAYPSVYSFAGKRSIEVRESWCPLFEKNEVKLCFENHNHAYKRTYPLMNQKIHEEGVVYMGDGAWGVEPREPRKANLWYLEKAKALNCFSLVTLEKLGILKVESFGLEGELIDEPKWIMYKAQVAKASQRAAPALGSSSQ